MAYKVQNYVNGLPNLRDENPESILEVLYAWYSKDMNDANEISI